MFCSYFLYPPEETTTEPLVNDSRPEQFRIVDHSVIHEIKRLFAQTLSEEDVGKESSRESVFVGALSRSLCCESLRNKEARVIFTVLYCRHPQNTKRST